MRRLLIYRGQVTLPECEGCRGRGVSRMALKFTPHPAVALPPPMTGRGAPPRGPRTEPGGWVRSEAGRQPVTYSARRSERPRASEPCSREESGWHPGPPRSSEAGLRARSAARWSSAPASRTERSRQSAPTAPGSPGFASDPALALAS